MTTRFIESSNNHSFFNLNDYPRIDREEIWQNSISDIFNVYFNINGGPQDLYAEMTEISVGSMMLIKTKTVSQIWERTPYLIHKNGIDHIMFQIFLDGEATDIRQDQQLKFESNLIICYDLARPIRNYTSAFTNLSLLVPRDRIEPLLNDVENIHLQQLHQPHGLNTIISNLLKNLFFDIQHLSPTEEVEIENSLLSLIATAFNNISNQHPNLVDLNYPKKKAIKKYISRNLNQPELTVETISTKFGLSRTSLYELFSDHGGVRRYIQEKRLDTAMRKLITQPIKHSSLYELALDSGYQSDNAFIRAFKQRFGTTPGQLYKKRREQTVSINKTASCAHPLFQKIGLLK